MRDVLQAHLERYRDCRDIGVAARGTEAWDDINHECRQAAYVEDWRDLEAEYERLRSQVNPHWQPLDWYATYVEPQSRTLPETVPTATTAATTPPPTTTAKQECLHRNVTATMLGDPEIWWTWFPDWEAARQLVVDDHADLIEAGYVELKPIGVGGSKILVWSLPEVRDDNGITVYNGPIELPDALNRPRLSEWELQSVVGRCSRGDRCHWLGHPDLGGDGLTYQTWYCNRLYGPAYDYLGTEYDYLKWDRRTGCPIEEIVPAMPGDEDCLYD